MKGNHIVRKMRQLNNIIGDCMEQGQELTWEQKFTYSNHTKALKKLGRKMDKAEKKYNNIWKHNVPKAARKNTDYFFKPIDDDTPQWGMGV